MKKLVILLSSIFLMVLVAGCSNTAQSSDTLPENAVLVFSEQVTSATGKDMNYGSWIAEQDTEGRLFVEVVCSSGRAKNLKLEYSMEGTGGSAHLGDFTQGTTTIEVENFYEPGGEYLFGIGNSIAFSGTLNIYYVPAQTR